MAVVVVLLLMVAVAVLVLAALSCLRYGTWSRRGVPHPRPIPLFGNLLRVALQREPLYVALDKLYHQFPGEPFVGFYGGSSPCLMVNDFEAIKDITVKDFKYFTDHNFLPSPKYDEMFSKFLFCQTGDDWKELRTKLTPSFSSGRLKNMFTKVKETGEQLVKSIKLFSDEEGVLDVGELMTRYGIDVIACNAFGCQGDSLLREEPSPHMKAVADAFHFGPLEALASYAMFFERSLYHLLGVGVLKKWRGATLSALLKEATFHREKEGVGKHNDIFDLLLSLRTLGGGLPADVFEAQVMQMQLAGSETSATSVKFALWELARNTLAQDKLRQELQEIVSKDGSITFENIKEAPYLDMVMKESLRLWPVMPMMDRKASDNYVFRGSGIRIEKGTPVYIPIYSIQRDPNIYDDPHTFKPERFHPDVLTPLQKQAWMPFGAGPRTCIGLRFANISVKSALAHVLFNYRVCMTEATPKTNQDLSMSPKDFILNPSIKLYLRFEPL